MITDKNVDSYIDDIINSHDSIISLCDELIETQKTIVDELGKNIKKYDPEVQAKIKTKYDHVNTLIRPYITDIINSLFSIIKAALNNNEYTRLYQILVNRKRLSGSIKDIDRIINNYSTSGKAHFLRELIAIFLHYETYYTYPHHGKGRYYDFYIYNSTHFKFTHKKTLFEEKSIYICDWFNTRNGRVKGGSKVPSAAKIMASAIRNAILNTGDPSLKSVWEYFENYTDKDPLILDTGIHDIYQETKDSNDEIMCLEEQKLVMTNTDNGEKREIKYRSLYHVIKEVKKDLSM